MTNIRPVWMHSILKEHTYHFLETRLVASGKSSEAELTLILFRAKRSTKWSQTYVYSLWEGRPKQAIHGCSLYRHGTQNTKWATPRSQGSFHRRDVLASYMPGRRSKNTETAAHPTVEYNSWFKVKLCLYWVNHIATLASFPHRQNGMIIILGLESVCNSICQIILNKQ